MLTFWAAMHAMGPQRAKSMTPNTLSPDQEAELCVEASAACCILPRRTSHSVKARTSFAQEVRRARRPLPQRRHTHLLFGGCAA